MKNLILTTLLLSLVSVAKDDVYRNSAEMAQKRTKEFQDLMDAITQRKDALKAHVKKINKQIEDKKRPNALSSCEKPDSKATYKVTLHDERQEAEEQLEELEQRAYAARVVLSNANTKFIDPGTQPSDFGTSGLKDKTLKASFAFPAKPAKFTELSFCDEVIKKYQIPEGMGLKMPVRDRPEPNDNK